MFDGFTLERVEVGEASSCGCGTAAPGRRWSCCTATRAPTRPGTGSRRCWPPGTPSSAPTCAATAVLEAADHSRTTRRTPSARWRATCAALMRGLGHERFAVVGHDRGSYVAFRLAMDHPDARQQLAVLDCIPIVEALERGDARFARPGGTGSSSPSRTSRPSARSPPIPTPGTGRPPEQMGAENHADYLARDPRPARR